MKLNDRQLYNLCKKYGHRARFWRQKFAGLLPEVYKRRLFEKKGYGSIFEFAAKLAGMSERQVDVVLNLEKKFETTPILRSMLENGEISVNKLARIASVATAENETFWATQAKLLSKGALETLIRDEKYAKFSGEANEIQNALLEPKIDQKFLPGHHANGKITMLQEVNLSAEVEQKLLELQQKGIDINALLLEFLAKRELEIAQEKERLARKSESPAKPPSRHIPAEIKNILKQEFGEKCSLPHCMRLAETIHHTRRFALSNSHNPYFLAPLCEEHHAIAHSIDVNIHSFRAPP
ncbi:hypothetical protein HYW83_00415 [Candidatus Peregrinibacteria bacterium]|nr:hypothetical protein [Candidatus Peregrinibacteria bacterium]